MKMNPLYKYQAFNPNNGEAMGWLHTLLETNKLHCSLYFSMNDPMEGAYDYIYNAQHEDDARRIIEDIRYGKSQKRICCLTKSYQHNLMWAYYGGGHTGICIEVDDILELKNNYKRFDIRYSKQKPHITSEMSKEEPILRILTTKSKQWEHEQEVRYIVNSGETLHVHIRRVFAGCNMKDKNYRILQEMIDEINRNRPNPDKIKLVKLQKENVDYGWGCPKSVN